MALHSCEVQLASVVIVSLNQNVTLDHLDLLRLILSPAYDTMDQTRVLEVRDRRPRQHVVAVWNVGSSNFEIDVDQLIP